MKLYEFAPTRSIRPRWMLQELGVPFEAVTVNLPTGEHRRPEFLKVNPAGKLPVLIDGDLVLNESAAIVLYLAEKYPERGFMPSDLRQRAEVYRWTFFAVTELEQPLWRIARHTSLYPEHQRLPGDVVLASREFDVMAAVLEKHMADRTFVTGDRLTAADFVLAYTLDWADAAQLLGRFPVLLAYRDRMYARGAAPRHVSDLLRELRAPASH